MVRVLLSGCNGRMGQAITRLVADRQDVEIVAGIDGYTGVPNSYPVYADVRDCTVAADVIIDFSNPAGFAALMDYAEKSKIAVVMATTGLEPDQIARLAEAARSIPVLRSANMSLGINLLLDLVQKATSILADNFDIEIVEKHHNQKLDAPSGTALAIADAINEELSNEYAYKYDRHLDRKKREKKEIGIHAVRGGTIVGEHSVIFAGKDEIFEINHTAMSREVFAYGAIRAALFLADQKQGMYTMKHLMQ